MAFGRAVICSTESALDETVGDAAIRVASHDVEGWADALVRLEADAEERRSLADAGRRHAAQFTWQNAAARHVEIYRAAISQ